MAGVTVRKVANDRDFAHGDMKVFFEFPWAIYKDDPNWVPPLLSARRKLLDRDKNPSWEYLTGEYYIAWRGETPVGIIAATVNKRHNEIWHEKLGWFGFFECFDDQEAATALLKAAVDYAKSQGMDAVRGPANFTLNDECALLIENFSRPAVLMPYNPPYYRRLIEEAGLGFDKVMDLESWYDNPELLAGPDRQGLPEKLVRVAEKTRQKRNITVRKSDSKSIKSDLRALVEVFKSAWAHNWGAVPPTEREVEALYHDLIPYYDPEIARFAEMNGEIVAFALALPDMNEVLIKAYARPGTPEWVTLLKAAWHWKIKPFFTREPCPKGVRVLLMGVKQEYRTIGIEAILNLSLFDGYLHQTRYWDADSGWFLETNQPMLSLAKAMRAYPYKRYRFFQAPVNLGAAPAASPAATAGAPAAGPAGSMAQGG
jgi:hypothetical protein